MKRDSNSWQAFSKAGSRCGYDGVPAVVPFVGGTPTLRIAGAFSAPAAEFRIEPAEFRALAAEFRIDAAELSLAHAVGEGAGG